MSIPPVGYTDKSSCSGDSSSSTEIESEPQMAKKPKRQHISANEVESAAPRAKKAKRQHISVAKHPPPPVPPAVPLPPSVVAQAERCNFTPLPNTELHFVPVPLDARSVRATSLLQSH